MSKQKVFAKKLEEIATMLGDQSPAIRFVHLANYLSDRLSNEEFLLACEEALKNETRLPSPAKFLEYAKGSDRDRAHSSLERVMYAMKKFSDMDGATAREFINDDAAWRVISSFGGWYNLVTAPNFNAFNFRSQFLNSYQSYYGEIQRSDLFTLSERREIKLIDGVPDYGPNPTEDQRQNIFDRKKEQAESLFQELALKKKL